MRNRRFFWKTGEQIRLLRMGCRNRPFFHLSVIKASKLVGRIPQEVIGSFDPMPNERNERLLSVDCDRLSFWLGKGAKPSRGVAALLGYAGLLTPSEEALLTAWRVRIQRENPEAPEVKQGKGRYTDDLLTRGIIGVIR